MFFVPDWLLQEATLAVERLQAELGLEEGPAMVSDWL